MLQQLNLFIENYKYDIQMGFKNEFQSLLRMIPHSEANYATHYLHKYPAKFLPHFSRIFIKYFCPNRDGVILDPMCGSGTTLIEACLTNHQSIGVEIDPIGYLISKVSTTPLPIQETISKSSTLLSEIRIAVGKQLQKNVILPTEDEFPNALLWFRKDVLQELLFIRDKILSIKDDKDFQNFLLLTFSSIVRNVSNADPRDIFPQRDKDLLIRERKDVLKEFAIALERNIKYIADFSTCVNGNLKCQVIQGDARGLQLLDESIDFVFTSPPYAYAMDYARIHQLNTLLLIMPNNKLRPYRRLYIGTDRIPVDKYKIINGHFPNYEGFEFASKEIESLYKQNKRYGLCLYQYFVDIHQITKEIYRVLKPNSYLVYVVGNSTINRTKFHTDKVFQSICKSVGFTIEDILERPYYAYRLTRKRNTHSNTIKSDMFIIAKK